MKKISLSRLWKRQWIAYSSLFFAVCMTACSGGGYSSNNGNPGGGNTYSISASLTGAQETPANSSVGTGTLTGTYDPSTYKITYTVTWSNISGAPMGMHFHGPAAAGVSGPVVVSITGFPTTASGTFSGTAVIMQDQAGDLLSGRWYINIHTATYPNGEIRGQITSTQMTSSSGSNSGSGSGY